MAGLDTILKAADLIADIRKAFSKIESLESNQKLLSEALGSLDKRVREIEASMREMKSDIRLEAVKEAQGIVNSVQSELYRQLKDVSIAVADIRRSREPVMKAIAGRETGSG